MPEGLRIPPILIPMSIPNPPPMVVGLTIPFILFALLNPGGAANPGGGLFAVENGVIPRPFIPGMGLDGESGVGGPIPPG